MQLAVSSVLLQLLATASTVQAIALPFELLQLPAFLSTSDSSDPTRQQQPQHQQQPLNTAIVMPDSSNAQPPVRGDVLLSDVLGSDRSINVFASYARDATAVASRLDTPPDNDGNSTVLAPLNSAVESLPRKPWEDPREYGAFGADAYEGDDGRDRAQRNLRRFVEAHVVPVSPWAEGQRVKSLLDGDREIWWETRAEDGKKVIQPDGIEVSSVASRVGNGEVWILKGVRNYA